MDNYDQKPLKKAFEKHDQLFTVPNPFDEHRRDKAGWYNKLKRIEEMVKAIRGTVDDFVIRQSATYTSIQMAKSHFQLLHKNNNVRNAEEFE